MSDMMPAYWYNPIVGGGGGTFGGNAATGQPAMTADQINNAMGITKAGAIDQAGLNNIFNNFGQQTDYYSGLGASYGRATGGFGGYGAANADPFTPVSDPFAGGAAAFNPYGGAGGIDWSKMASFSQPQAQTPDYSSLWSGGASPFQGFGGAGGIDWSMYAQPQAQAQPDYSSLWSGGTSGFQMPNYGGLDFGKGFGGFDSSQYFSNMPDYSSLWSGGTSGLQAGGGLPAYNAFDPSAWQSAFKMPDYGGLGFGTGQGYGGFDNSQYLSGLQGWGTDAMQGQGRDALAGMMSGWGGFGAGASPFSMYGGDQGLGDVWSKAFGQGASAFQMPDYGGLGFGSGQGFGGFDNSAYLSGLGDWSKAFGQQPQAGANWPSYAGDPSVNFGGLDFSKFGGAGAGFSGMLPSLMGGASPAQPYGAFDWSGLSGFGGKDQSQFPQGMMDGMLGGANWGQGGMIDPSSLWGANSGSLGNFGSQFYDYSKLPGMMGFGGDGGFDASSFMSPANSYNTFQMGATNPNLGFQGWPGAETKQLFGEGSGWTDANTFNTFDQAAALAAQRAPFMQQLQNDPNAMNRMLGLMSAEMGQNSPPDERMALAESIFNRGAAQGYGNIFDVMSKGYYEPLQTGTFNTHLSNIQNNPAYQQQLMNELNRVAYGGTNISNLATDNASGSVGANAQNNQLLQWLAPYNNESFTIKAINPGLHGAGVVNNNINWLQGLMQ